MYFLKTEMYIRYFTKEVLSCLYKDPDNINEIVGTKRKENNFSVYSFFYAKVIYLLWSSCEN